ncbi:MAG: hypothetical protein DRQ39_10495 [Gammaproteobacteria bacterium]|nr:MAG: hypothetical protein DRQ39_10495 [Gammaproteobacteria bacterium]
MTDKMGIDISSWGDQPFYLSNTNDGGGQGFLDYGNNAPMDAGVNTQSFGGQPIALGQNIPGAEAIEGAGGSFMDRVGNGDFGSMQGWGQLAGGLGDIGQAYMAYKNYGLAKDQFAFNKDITNRNLSNQSITVNAKLEAWAKARGMSVPKTDGSAIG